VENKLIPIEENANKGYHYSITEEQMEEYSKLTLFEKLEWIEKTNQFIYSIQTDKEREMRRNIGNMEL